MESDRPAIGLALSGGGSRAIAFHLGCLRALHRLGLLDRIAVISTVSGGSVIGACFRSHSGDFPSFEKKIRKLLSLGLVRPMMARFFSVLGLKIVASFIVVGLISACLSLVRLTVKCVGLIMPRAFSRHWQQLDIRAPLRRFASRTDLLEAALDDLLFDGLRLTDLPQGPHLVVNATELRTGSAFRFGTMESGSWRWGRLRRNDATVAHAVAASAAYPLLLPAFDEILSFEKNGVLADGRVILTDGGVYDNLGLGCLWPDRSREIGLNVIPVDTIICCSAGYGLRQEPPSQFLVARMLSVFSTIFDRAQNAAMYRLHEAKRSSQIKSFILPYLGQLDREVPDPPPDLVRREQAHAYPTDFSAMEEEWIDRLSLRGEQLTLCLARAYIPELIQGPA